MYTPRFRRRNSFCLPLTDKFTFRLRDVAQKLQYNVRNQRPRQIAALPGVQQRHIQHKNGRAFFSRNEPPLLQYFIIVPSQPVDALDNKRITGSYFSEQPAVSLPFKIRTGAFVQIDVCVRDAGFTHCCHLPRLVLISG